MAATTPNSTPRKNGFDFAALSASAGKQDGGDERERPVLGRSHGRHLSTRGRA